MAAHLATVLMIVMASVVYVALALLIQVLVVANIHMIGVDDLKFDRSIRLASLSPGLLAAAAAAAAGGCGI